MTGQKNISLYLQFGMSCMISVRRLCRINHWACQIKLWWTVARNQYVYSINLESVIQCNIAPDDSPFNLAFDRDKYLHNKHLYSITFLNEKPFMVLEPLPP